MTTIAVRRSVGNKVFFNTSQLLGGASLNIPARTQILTNSDVTDTFSPGVHRFTDNASDISSNWVVLQTLDAAHSQTASQFGGGDPAICCGLNTAIGTSTIPSAVVQLNDSGGVPAGTVCKVFLARSDGNAALWTSVSMAGVSWTTYTINPGDWGTFTNGGFPANSVTIVFHFPSNPGGAFASISGIQFFVGTGITRIPAGVAALDFDTFNTLSVEMGVANFDAGDSLVLRVNTIDLESAASDVVGGSLGILNLINATGNGNFAQEAQVPGALSDGIILPFTRNVFELVNLGLSDVTVNHLVAWLTNSTRGQGLGFPGGGRGLSPLVQLIRPNRNNSAGLPGIDWACSAGGTNGEAMTDDAGSDLAFSTFIRRTGGLGSSTTYGNNMTLATTTTKRDGWKFYFTTRTSFVGTNVRMFLHIRSGANPPTDRTIAGPNHIGARDFTATAAGNAFSFTLTNAEATNLDFPGQPWHVSTDFSGIDESQTWDFAQFLLTIPR
jgi:hypothetical protein